MASTFAIVTTTPPLSRQVYSTLEAEIRVPQRPLIRGALEIVSLHENLMDEASVDVCSLLHKISQLWTQQQQAPPQYLVYGKQELSESSFTWQMVPYRPCHSLISRIAQQFLVLWRITFDATALGETAIEQQVQSTREALATLPVLDRDRGDHEGEEIQFHAQDPFCLPANIARQRIYEGEHINVLLNHAPLGKDKLHFLFTTKRHIENFEQLREVEFVEITNLAQGIFSKLSQDLPYLRVAEHFFKTGRDAGQTVGHFHYQLVLTSSVADNFFGKLHVLKNILFGSSRMPEEAFQKKLREVARSVKPSDTPSLEAPSM